MGTDPNAGGRAPTIKVVAALAGVSPMTVSRTLAGGTNVKPDVQAKVLAAVRALGYRRNENARVLRPGQTSSLIGVAITNLGNPYYGRFALGVEEVAAQHGRRILLGNSSESPAREQQLVQDFLGRRVEGLIVVPASASAPYLTPAAVGDVPIVLASRLVDGLDVDAIVLDDAGGAERCTAHLLETAGARVAYVGNFMGVYTEQRRYDGFVAAHAAVDREVDPRLVLRDERDPELVGRVIRGWFDEPDAPTGIFTANNRNTVAVLQALGGRPGAAALPTIASFDEFELAEQMPMPIAVLQHDPTELGRRAAQLLFARLDGTAPVARQVVSLPTPLRLVHP
ncbi:MAG TPA: LacI family DNA-binding transcriptional regulator [Candidatus Lumbricidophila sp.]|nr:LacI family DNA-binding transcriptional regulator [Candidatus Lumbricidophila sp.]